MLTVILRGVLVTGVAALVLAGRASAQNNCANTVWCDDFAGAKGAPPDAAKWNFDTGNKNGWGNRELEFYCSPAMTTAPCDPAKPNAFLDGSGHLVIQASRISASPSVGSWTSARMLTKGLATFQYGRIEARMQLPVGAGLWPAFWALGTPVNWPNSGEIDFMENVPAPVPGGLGPTKIRSTLHGPTYHGGNGLGQNFTLPNGGRVDDANYLIYGHIYGAIWSPNMVQFYVDDPRNVFFVRTASDAPGGASQWAFNHQFFLLMNLAVGGSWPGNPDSSTPSPAQMLVDFVRVFENPKVNGPRMAAPPVTVKAGTPGDTTLHLAGSSTNDGRVYLTCSTTAPEAACSINSGYVLNGVSNPSVVDFSSGKAKTATVTVTTTANSVPAPPGNTGRPPGSYTITVTATTVSGDTSTASIPLTVK